MKIDMIPEDVRKEVYAEAAKLLFEQKNVVDAIYCWQKADVEMPKQELIRIANNEFSIGNRELAAFIYKAIKADTMAEFIEKN